MATFQFEGVDDYISQLKKLYDDTGRIEGRAIYEGASTVIKYIRQGIDGLSTDNRFGTSQEPSDGPNTYEKQGLQMSLGISEARHDGSFYNVKIGFDGYDNMKTKKWPNGRPHSMIARSIESGTSFMRKQPFMRKAEQAAKGPCEKVMQKTIDDEIKDRMK